MTNDVREISRMQCFYFSRNIGQVTPKIIYFYYLKIIFWIQVSKKTFHLILKTEALVACGTNVKEQKDEVTQGTHALELISGLHGIYVG